VDNTVGDFASTLYVRARSGDRDTLEDLLKCVIDDYWQSYAIPDFCYLGAQVPRPEFSKAPSFNWLPPDLKTTQSAADAAAGSLTSEPISFRNSIFEQAGGDSDPNVVFQETGDEVYGNVVFPLNRFSVEMMERFVPNFLVFLKTMLTTPETRVKDIPLVGVPRLVESGR
jgi:hypothetical protein